ncbi:MAG: molybdopterin converting factor subunit 1 [Thaumarchaeota archaeon]|nr:molybdopterin converting factor subunit 1 [Nitrososphaerota archaeon]
MTIRVKVLYFGQTKDAAGRAEEEYHLTESMTLEALVDKAGAEHANLSKMRASMQVALNEEIASGKERLKDGDVVALIPPVAGG